MSSSWVRSRVESAGDGAILNAFKNHSVLRFLTALGAPRASLEAVQSHPLLLGYTVVFAMTAVWFVLGTVFVRQIRGVR